MKKRGLFVYALFLVLAKGGIAQSSDHLRFEKNLNEAIHKVYTACVRIYRFDSTKKTQNSSQFSGVVVSAEGHILTVAHAVAPSRIYKVTFADGKECLAIALGRMVTQSNNRPDVAMMKIINGGSWPFAEPGWSTDLVLNQPCFGISYPESLGQLKPLVRFGTISNPINQWGFFESTCIMETGDSGGPLFDMLGRVIGVHSRIDKSEGPNYEVPIEIYRKYWTALNIAKNYSALPSTEDDIPADLHRKELMAITADSWVNIEWVKSAGIQGKTVLITSNLNDTVQRITGTVFAKKDFRLKKSASGSVVISKNSMVGTNPFVQLSDGKNIKAEILTRDSVNDLVLLSIVADIPSAINLRTIDTSQLDEKDLGKFLYSALPEQKTKQSVVGSEFRGLPAPITPGYFGASALFIKGKVTLTGIPKNSPAEKDGLITGDAILSINGVSLKKPEDYGGELSKYMPGDKVLFECLRKDSSFSKLIELIPRSEVIGTHPAERFEGGKSKRRDRFDVVFLHDARIRSYECGSPVFDASGSFRGINIARFSHTTTVVIPASVIYKFVVSNTKD